MSRQCRDEQPDKRESVEKQARRRAGSAIVGERVLLDAMPQLVIGQTQRLGGLALVPAVLAEREFDDRALMRTHC